MATQSESTSLPQRQQEISEALLTIIRDSVVELPENSNGDTDLFNEGLDSMGIMNLILVIEENFQVQLAPADVTREHFATPLSIANIITLRQNE